MTEALNDIKIRLINRITLLADADVLFLLDKVLDNGKLDREDWLMLSLHAPVREKTDLDELIKAQNYRGPDRERFQRAARDMDIQEPVEDLLALLTK
jgi:hypothetical protein